MNNKITWRRCRKAKYDVKEKLGDHANSRLTRQRRDAQKTRSGRRNERTMEKTAEETANSVKIEEN
jgi:hypothetical protein